MAWCTSTLVEGGHEISSPTEKKRGLGRNQLIIIDLLIERRSVPVISRYFACRKDFSDVTSLYRGSDFLPLDTSGSRNTWRVHSSLKPTLISANHVSALSSLNKSCSRPNFSLKHYIFEYCIFRRVGKECFCLVGKLPLANQSPIFKTIT
jgi:hypothetical protein